jgi:hypothetical protein
MTQFQKPSGPSRERSRELHDLAEAMSAVTRRVDEAGGRPLDGLAEATLDGIPAAEAVSLTVLERGRFRTEAWTDEMASRADGLQYELGVGPCVDAVLERGAYLSGDVARDERWGPWGPRVEDEVGVRSVIAYRLVLEGDRDAVASLNVYSTRAEAFDEQALHRGVVLATHGSLLVTAMMAREAAEKLATALQGNREVGVAMGVLMHRHRLTREQAFDLLRMASQDGNRPLSAVATEVADTGDLTSLRQPLGTAQDRPDAPPVDVSET